MTPTYSKLLPQFVKFKSISTDPQFADEIEKTVQWLKYQFLERKFVVVVVGDYQNPIVVARYQADPAAKTVLIYGHYDVQPADGNNSWDSDPFTVTEREGRLFGRGTVDNKGQVLVHMATVFDLIAEKKLLYNVVFMIEGNEETGSPGLTKFIEDHADLIQADFALISDGETTGGHPTLDSGFRGVINLQLTLTTSDRELHSGLFGGGVPNAAQELTRLVGSLFDQKHRVTIPGFYTDAEPLDPKLVKILRNFPVSQETVRELSGCSTLLVSTDQNFYIKNGLLPALEITGLTAGYSGVGFKNSIPASAQVKINVRPAPTQSAEQLAKKLVRYFKKQVPKYARLEIVVDQISQGILLDQNHDYFRRAQKIMAKSYEKEPIIRICGATLPIASLFHAALGIPQIYASIGNEDCMMHAANENFSLEFVNKALLFSRAFLEK